MTIHLFWFTDPRDNKFGAYQFSNQEIQKNFLLEFSNYGDVVWHHSNARGRVTWSGDDILVGHPPWPPAGQNPYDNWAFDNGLDGPRTAHPNTFIVLPWAAAVVAKTQNAVDHALEMILASRGLFGMGGLIHYDENIVKAGPETIWRRAQSKLVRINMGCDVRFLPHNEDGRRRSSGLLHVSSLRPYKRPEFMLASLPREACTLYIGTDRQDIVGQLAAQGHVPPNVRVIGELKNDDPAMNKFILESCSYYLHCSKEAQSTAILENAARGLIPLLTPHAGFSSPDAIYLSEESADENRRIIADALAMPDEEYRARSHALRQHIAMYHSWQRICQNMYIAMRALMAGQDVPRRGEDYS